MNDKNLSSEKIYFNTHFISRKYIHFKWIFHKLNMAMLFISYSRHRTFLGLQNPCSASVQSLLP